MAYPGQGMRVQEAGIDGEWMLEGEFFLDAATEAQLDGGPLAARPIVTKGGKRAYGIGADRVAKELGITGNDLFAMNRSGDVGCKLVAPFAAGSPATLFLSTALGTVQVEVGPE